MNLQWEFGDVPNMSYFCQFFHKILGEKKHFEIINIQSGIIYQTDGLIVQ